MSRIRANNAKRKLSRGEPVVCAGGIDTPDLVERFGAAGLVDVAWMDMEHGSWGWSDLSNFARACDLWGVTSHVRVQSNDPADIVRVLDQGIQSIIIPHVLTVADAERAVESAFYVPKGSRGMGLSRQSYGVDDYFETANDEVMLGLIIEDIQAVANLEAILAVDGVDYLFVAPYDLSQSMGPEYVGRPHDPEVRAVVVDTVRRIVAAERAAGTIVNEETVEEFLGFGTRFLLYSPIQYLFEGARRFRETVEHYTPEPRRE